MSIHQVSKVYSEEFVPSCPICCVFSCFFCHGHSLLLSFYLLKISLGRFFLQHLWVLSPGSWSSPSRVFCPWASTKSYFWPFSFYISSLVQTLKCGPIGGTPRSSIVLPSLGKSRVAPKPPKVVSNCQTSRFFAASTQYFVTKSLLTVIFVTAADQSIHNFLQFDAQSWASR